MNKTFRRFFDVPDITDNQIISSKESPIQLFGAMAYQYFRKNIKLACVPLILMTLLFVFVPSLISQTSMMIIPSGALTIGLAYLTYRKKGSL